jgi:hypothetical protein
MGLRFSLFFSHTRGGWELKRHGGRRLGWRGGLLGLREGLLGEGKGLG